MKTEAPEEKSEMSDLPDTGGFMRLLIIVPRRTGGAVT